MAPCILQVHKWVSLQTKAAGAFCPPIQRQRPPSCAMLLQIRRAGASHRVERRTNHSPKVFLYTPHVLVAIHLFPSCSECSYLKFGAKRDDAHLVRADDILAGLFHRLIRSELRHAIGKQQQNEAALQQINTKEVRHECQLRINGENRRYRLRRGNRMRGALRKPFRRDPVVPVVQHGNGIPLSVQQDVQDVQDMRAVCLDEPHAGLVAVRRLRRVHGGQAAVHAHGHVAEAAQGQVAAEAFEAELKIGEQFRNDNDGVRIVKAAEAGMVAPVVQLDDVAEDSHERQEVFKEAGARGQRRWTDMTDGQLVERYRVEILPNIFRQGGCGMLVARMASPV